MSVPTPIRDNPVAVRAAIYAQLAELFAELPDRPPAAILTRLLAPLPTLRIIECLAASPADTLRNLRAASPDRAR